MIDRSIIRRVQSVNIKTCCTDSWTTYQKLTRRQ